MCVVLFQVHKSRKNVEAHSPTPAKTPGVSSPAPLMRQHSQRQDEIRLTRMMLIIFCSFLLCFLPLMIVNVLEEKIRLPTVHVMASVLAWMSSCINPIIYAAMNRQYRQAYVRLFCGNKRRVGANNSSSSTARSGSSHSKTLMSEVFVFNPTTNGTNGHCNDKNKKNEENKI
ncbi:unnamed protein product [Larinioides sclopetarius]|uniref:G-protein coupled receptors family 1 profile domain-containing protein n=1 Tax=Larinioides sclopetarius TaxID=280406 RepID=A0AAV2B2P2_9ARAC